MIFVICISKLTETARSGEEVRARGIFLPFTCQYVPDFHAIGSIGLSESKRPIGLSESESKMKCKTHLVCFGNNKIIQIKIQTRGTHLLN